MRKISILHLAQITLGLVAIISFVRFVTEHGRSSAQSCQNLGEGSYNLFALSLILLLPSLLIPLLLRKTKSLYWRTLFIVIGMITIITALLAVGFVLYFCVEW